MTAKEFLAQGRWIDKRIEFKLEEVERLHAKLTTGRMARLTGMPRGGKGVDFADSIAQVIALEEQINAEIKKLCTVKRQIIEAIAAVEDMRYRTLLEYRYRNDMQFDCIAKCMGYDNRQILRLHGEALRRIKVPGQ